MEDGEEEGYEDCEFEDEIDRDATEVLHQDSDIKPPIDLAIKNAEQQSIEPTSEDEILLGDLDKILADDHPEDAYPLGGPKPIQGQHMNPQTSEDEILFGELDKILADDQEEADIKYGQVEERGDPSEEVSESRVDGVSVDLKDKPLNHIFDTETNSLSLSINESENYEDEEFLSPGTATKHKTGNSFKLNEIQPITPAGADSDGYEEEEFLSPEPPIVQIDNEQDSIPAVEARMDEEDCNVNESSLTENDPNSFNMSSLSFENNSSVSGVKSPDDVILVYDDGAMEATAPRLEKEAFIAQVVAGLQAALNPALSKSKKNLSIKVAEPTKEPSQKDILPAQEAEDVLSPLPQLRSRRNTFSCLRPTPSPHRAPPSRNSFSAVLETNAAASDIAKSLEKVAQQFRDDFSPNFSYELPSLDSDRISPKRGFKRSMTDSLMRALDLTETAEETLNPAQMIMHNLDIAIPSVVLADVLSPPPSRKQTPVHRDRPAVGTRRASRTDLSNEIKKESSHSHSQSNVLLTTDSINEIQKRVLPTRSSVFYSSAVQTTSSRIKDLVEDAAVRAIILVDYEHERLQKAEMMEVMKNSASFATASAHMLSESNEEVKGHARGFGFRSLKAGLKKMDLRKQARPVAQAKKEYRMSLTSDIHRRLSKLVSLPENDTIIAAAASAAAAAVAQSPSMRSVNLKDQKELAEMVQNIREHLTSMLEDDADSVQTGVDSDRTSRHLNSFRANKLSRTTSSSNLLTLSTTGTGTGTGAATMPTSASESNFFSSDKMRRRNSAPVKALTALVKDFDAAQLAVINHAYPILAHVPVLNVFKAIQSETFIETSGYKWARPKRNDRDAPGRRSLEVKATSPDGLQKQVGANLHVDTDVNASHIGNATGTGNGTGSKKGSVLTLAMRRPLLYQKERLLQVDQFACKVSSDNEVDQEPQVEQRQYQPFSTATSSPPPPPHSPPSRGTASRYRIVKLLKETTMVRNPAEGGGGGGGVSAGDSKLLLQAAADMEPVTLSKIMRPQRYAKPPTWCGLKIKPMKAPPPFDTARQKTSMSPEPSVMRAATSLIIPEAECGELMAQSHSSVASQETNGVPALQLRQSLHAGLSSSTQMRDIITPKKPYPQEGGLDPVRTPRRESKHGGYGYGNGYSKEEEEPTPLRMVRLPTRQPKPLLINVLEPQEVRKMRKVVV